MRARAWTWSLLAAGLVLSSAPRSPAASARFGGGGLSLRFRSGGFSANFQVFDRYYRARGYYPGGYGYYPGGYGYFYPPRIYPPNYYGGYFSVYPAFGYGYPYDDFPIYDFPVYAGLPLIPAGFFSPNWPGWYAPIYLWPRLFLGGPGMASPAPRVEEFRPRERTAPVPPKAPGTEEKPSPEARPEPEAPAAPGAAEGGKARAEPRTVRMGRLEVDWSDGTRTQVRWTGDPRVIGELRVEELDAGRRQITERRIDAYPFHATFERDLKTVFLKVTALAGDETLATAIFSANEQQKPKNRKTD
jgi:hypothetical protein